MRMPASTVFSEFALSPHIGHARVHVPDLTVQLQLHLRCTTDKPLSMFASLFTLRLGATEHVHVCLLSAQTYVCVCRAVAKSSVSCLPRNQSIPPQPESIAPICNIYSPLPRHTCPCSRQFGSALVEQRI